MQNWLNFWCLFFWLTMFGFILNPTGFISLVLYSEITWLTLYILAIITGSLNDDINLLSLTFLLLGFAGLEFSIAFLLLILFKIYSLSLIFNDENKILLNFINKKKNLNNINNFIWIK